MPRFNVIREQGQSSRTNTKFRAITRDRMIIVFKAVLCIFF